MIDEQQRDPNLFVRVDTADSKYVELYWLNEKLELRGNSDMGESAKLFFNEVAKIANDYITAPPRLPGRRGTRREP